MEEEIFDDARDERERQRSESEARDIIHDLDKLYTYDEDKKTRWIWELLQNAKDVADAVHGVNIVVKLSNDELTFSHNGLPFKTTHLLALLYKTSTKSLGGEEGTTGKYGTGFVTTHLLSRKVKISGIHVNKYGRRHFEMMIDRTSTGGDENTALKAMQQSLADTFLVIDAINKRPAEEVASLWHTFSYALSPESHEYAKRGVEELQRNVAFTLAINDRIKSVRIDADWCSQTYVATPQATPIDCISYLSNTTDCGILFTKSAQLTIAIPARKTDEGYVLLPIEHQAILYKEFPLIGTENFHLPVFIQHKDFHPTELREGIRTKKGKEDEEDLVADRNRKALMEFVTNYLDFIGKIIAGGMKNTYLFAQSGLPQYLDKFSNRLWYETFVQAPIRSSILEQQIVGTTQGGSKKISDVRFPSPDLFKNDDFYALASELLPDLLPDKESVWPWCEIISQESSSWPEDISINEEELVKLVPQKIKSISEKEIEWLKRFYQYLEMRNINHWGEKYPIYLNEANYFCLRKDVSIHPNIDEEFKLVSKGLGRTLEAEFLNRKLGKINAIKEFDLLDFYSKLNKELISELRVEKATSDQVKAIFHVCTLFRSDKATKREKWHGIIQQLLPTLVGERKPVSVDYDNYWRSAELWSIRYICHLIIRAGKPSIFAAHYFQSDESSTFDWLKDFLTYLFQLKEENSEVFLKASIIPMQTDSFLPYDDHVYVEQDVRYFDETIKNIYHSYTGKGDPRRRMIDRRAVVEGMRTRTVEVLTNEIDALFRTSDIEKKVKKGGGYNEMFLQLNSWFEQFAPASSGFLRTFDANRNSLYVLALGEGFGKQVMELKNSGRSMEEITELSKVQLTNQQIKQLEAAAGILGADKLLMKTQELLDSKEEINRWRKIGSAAEMAFQEAITHLDVAYEITNPDVGKDFDLVINAQGYSIEIKSVVVGKENVRMSILQGRTAVANKDRYALCVVTRPTNEADVVDKEYFMAHSQFVMDIGRQIGDRISDWDAGLRTLQRNAEISVQLDAKIESVYINRDIWRRGISFHEFIRELKELGMASL